METADKIISAWETIKVMLIAHKEAKINKNWEEFFTAQTKFNSLVQEIDEHKFDDNDLNDIKIWKKYYDELKSWQKNNYVTDTRLNKKVAHKLVDGTIVFLINWRESLSYSSGAR